MWWPLGKAQTIPALEFTAKGIMKLYSWQEGRSEIEFLYVMNTQIIPIEIKSGWVTRSQSLKKMLRNIILLIRTRLAPKRFTLI